MFNNKINSAYTYFRVLGRVQSLKSKKSLLRHEVWTTISPINSSITDTKYANHKIYVLTVGCPLIRYLMLRSPPPVSLDVELVFVFSLWLNFTFQWQMEHQYQQDPGEGVINVTKVSIEEICGGQLPADPRFLLNHSFIIGQSWK